MKTSLFAFAAILGGTTAPVFSQPSEAAAVDVWDLVEQIQLEEIVTTDSYEIRKAWPAGFPKELSDIRVTGFAAAGVPGESVRELLLTSDSGICPLCGSGDHGATLQITLDQPIEGLIDGQRIAVEGKLMRIDDSTTWQSAQIINARVLDF